MTGYGLLGLSARPVVIIGAGRSGTNMLRDVLVRLEGVDTWPCDEINYIWRHGQRERDTDEFDAADATPETKRFIRDRFRSMAWRADFGNASPGARVLVEKTCANSLRVDFVRAVVPEARFLYLVRDGRDVVASASRRWKAALDLPYLLAKARYVPPSDLAYYATRYFANRVAKLRDPDARLALWGPRFEGWRELASRADLETVCAAQWTRCVERSDDSFARMPAGSHLTLRYEHLVASPVETIRSVTDFLDLHRSDDEIAKACAGVHARSVGLGAATDRDSSRAASVMADMLARHGYL